MDDAGCDLKNYAVDRGQRYPARPKAEVHNTLRAVFLCYCWDFIGSSTAHCVKLVRLFSSSTKTTQPRLKSGGAIRLNVHSEKS